MAEPITFPGQTPSEKVFLFIRHHWFNFLPTLFMVFGMLILPLIILFTLHRAFPNFTNEPYRAYVALATGAYLLFVCLFFIVSWLDYYFDILVITDERLVHIEQNSLFNRHISELNLLRVQNVSTEIEGVFPTMFDFGDLTIETAGAMAPNEQTENRFGDFNIESIPHPNQLSQTILRLHDEIINKRRLTTSTATAEGESVPDKNDDSDQTISTPPPEVAAPPQKEEPSSPPESPTVEPPEDSPPLESTPAPPAPTDQIKDEGELKEGETIDL